MIPTILPAAVVSEDRLKGVTYALVVNGISKDAEDSATRDRVVNDLRTCLQEKASITPDRLIVLSAGASTAEAIKKAIAAFAAAGNRDDRFVFYYLGQANAVGDSLRLNVAGPDITQADLAQWLARIEATTQLVVLDCPCAGMTAKALVRAGRVIVCASTEEQAYAPRFSLHFVPALVRPESDANQNGSVSVLEAFTAAAREIEQWYQQARLLPTETPCLEDDGDGRPGQRPWRYEQDGGDGRLAARLFLTPEVRP